jgi:phosphoglycolate phosphatase
VITHVIFDFDGTLVDSREVVTQLYNELAERNGYGKVTAANQEAIRSLSLLERCSQLKVPLYKLPGLIVQISRNYQHVIQSIAFIEGIPELLRELRGRGLKLLVVSTNNESNIRALLEQHATGQWVEDVYCSSRVLDKARLLRTLMTRHSLAPRQIVYVGDEHRDVEACREAGIRVIAVRWGFDSEARLQQAQPDYIAHRPAEIAECVARWSA